MKLNLFCNGFNLIIFIYSGDLDIERKKYTLLDFFLAFVNTCSLISDNI